jgi:phospholipid transport system substrate-binding protein
MKTKFSIGLLLTVLIAAEGFEVSAAAEIGPSDFLKSKDNTLKPLLSNVRKNKNEIIFIVREMMDFEALSKASLGIHWDKRNADEQKEFSTTLRQLIEDNLVDRLHDSKDHEVTYEDEKVNQDKTEGSVTTIIRVGKGKRLDEIEIVYKLKKKGISWIVVDMITDGVSLVGNYQAEFNKIINSDGFEGLMKKMKDKMEGKTKASGNPKPAE